MSQTDLAGVLAAIRGLSPGRRLIAICGAPGSGKSTLAATLAIELAKNGRPVPVVPMDGFHLDNRLLKPAGLLPRKGAPESFDNRGFLRLVTALHAGEECIIPVFDRERDIAIAGAAIIPGDAGVVLFEGNYLMFDAPVWRELAPLWDLSIWLEVPEQVLARRLTQRWLDHGLSAEAARARAEGNDLANARLVNRASLPADLTLAYDPAGGRG